MRDAKRLSKALAANAQFVCERFLSNGRRDGAYWRVGNVYNEKGNSCWVRLYGNDGPPGRWGDFADPGSGGDLLDLLQVALGLPDIRDAMDEARALLSLPRDTPVYRDDRTIISSDERRQRARNLLGYSRSISNTFGARYLSARGVWRLNHPALRFHPTARYLGADKAMREGPAVITKITGPNGEFFGAHRTWFRFDDGNPIAFERKMMGPTLGGAAYFGGAGNIAVIGEGLESTLSLDGVLPRARLYAGLSTSGMRNWIIPAGVEAILIAVDRDENDAGPLAGMWLTSRAAHNGVPAFILWPRLGDFNEDLQADGIAAVAASIRRQVCKISLFKSLLLAEDVSPSKSTTEQAATSAT